MFNGFFEILTIIFHSAGYGIKFVCAILWVCVWMYVRTDVQKNIYKLSISILKVMLTYAYI
jgi:hypothetical protein